MSKSEWKNVKSEHIIAAIQKFDMDKPTYPKPKEYYLVFRGHLYPSKEIRRMAYKEVYPEKEIPEFHGGKDDTQPFFEKRGFEIFRRKNNVSYVAEETEDIILKEEMNLIDDAEIEDIYEEVAERPVKMHVQKQSYERNPKIARYALKMAKYQCNIDPWHSTFIRKTDETPYVEPHHLVPMSKQDEFEFSLDVPQNIVSLCSNCHNEIHYGVNSKILIEKLFFEREEGLKKMGIDISLEKLQSYYTL